MNHTTPDMERFYEEWLSSLPPSRRAVMASDMFACAQLLALASLSPEDRDSRPKVRRHLFLRFYGNDFSEPQRSAILSYLSEEPAE